MVIELLNNARLFKKHPNVYQIHGVSLALAGQTIRHCHLISEFVEGVTLQEFMEKNFSKVMNKREVILDIMEQLIQGVYFMHHCGIVHCDLNSKNVMIKESTNSDGVTSCKATIIDLGVSIQIGNEI